MQLARSAGFRTDGVEIAPELACEAARRYGLRVHTGNLSNAPSHLRGYDVVTAWDVLEHCPDPHLVIQEVARRMLPGGLVLLRVPDFSFASRGLPPDFVKRYLGGMYPLDPDQHALHFTPEALSLVLEAHGLEVLEAWGSQADEYTPKSLPGYAELLVAMDQHGVHCEFAVLARKLTGAG